MKNEEKLRALLTVEAVLQGQMVKEFDEVVFSGRPGMLYGPVKTQFGYHLIVIKSLS
jgi:parvulin-like peptidyl-prolyl isomerase